MILFTTGFFLLAFEASGSDDQKRDGLRGSLGGRTRPLFALARSSARSNNRSAHDGSCVLVGLLGSLGLHLIQYQIQLHYWNHYKHRS